MSNLTTVDDQFICPRCGSHHYGSVKGNRELKYYCHGRCLKIWAKEECFQVVPGDFRKFESTKFKGANVKGKDLLNWITGQNLNVDHEYEIAIRRIK